MNAPLKSFSLIGHEIMHVLSIDGVDVIEETWQKELEALLVYNARLEETAHKFKLTYDNTIELICLYESNATGSQIRDLMHL